MSDGLGFVSDPVQRVCSCGGSSFSMLRVFCGMCIGGIAASGLASMAYDFRTGVAGLEAVTLSVSGYAVADVPR
jgi:hypothetical protein